MKTHGAIFACVLACTGVCAEYGPKKVSDWEIKGTVELDGKPFHLNVADAAFQLIHMRENGTHHYEGRIFNLESEASGAFRIWPLRVRPSEGTYRMGLFYKGRVAVTTEAFVLSQAHPRPEGLVLRLGAQGDTELRFRAIHPLTGEAVPDLLISVRIAENPDGEALSSIAIAEVVTDKKGIASIRSIPKCKYKLTLVKSGDHWSSSNQLSIVGPFGIMEPEVASESEQALREKGEAKVFWLPMGMGMIWRPLIMNHRIAKPGTVWTLTALEKSDELDSTDSWNSKLSLSLTVGDDYLVKSPPIPNGRYRIAATDAGSSIEDVIGVNGFYGTVDEHDIKAVLDEIEREKTK